VNDECERFRERLGDYVYGESAQTAALDRHLEQCSGCRRELEATRRALAAVDRAGLGSAPEEVVDEVILGVTARLHRDMRRVARRRWLRAVASVAACLLLGALGAWFFVFSDGKGSAVPSNGQLELETRAVAAEAESVLRLLDELDRENRTLLQLLGGDAVDQPGVEPDEKEEPQEQV